MHIILFMLMETFIYIHYDIYLCILFIYTFIYTHVQAAGYGNYWHASIHVCLFEHLHTHMSQCIYQYILCRIYFWDHIFIFVGPHIYIYNFVLMHIIFIYTRWEEAGSGNRWKQCFLVRQCHELNASSTLHELHIYTFTGRWIWKSLKTKAGGAVPWNIQVRTYAYIYIYTVEYTGTNVSIYIYILWDIQERIYIYIYTAEYTGT